MSHNNNYTFSVLIPILLFLSTCSNTCHATNFLEEPSVQWTYRLPGSGTLSGRGLRSGNEVLASPNGDTVFVTADDGSLHLIATNNRDNSIIFEPDPVAGTFTECRSGVTLVYDPNTPNQVNYVVYAVIDVPVSAGVLYGDVTFDTSRTSILSRLLAVNLDGSLRWSVAVNGAVVGKAVVGGGTQQDKIYVVHNVPNFIGSAPTRGKISVVLLRGNQQPIVTASVSPLNRNGPFGPPAGSSVTMNGQKRDVIVVAEAWDQGYSPNGSLYMLRPSSLYDGFEGQGNDAYELRLISDWAVASVARPLLGQDANELYVSAMGARVGGWTGSSSLTDDVAGREENLEPAWDVSLEPHKGNASFRKYFT